MAPLATCTVFRRLDPFLTAPDGTTFSSDPASPLQAPPALEPDGCSIVLDADCRRCALGLLPGVTLAHNSSRQHRPGEVFASIVLEGTAHLPTSFPCACNCIFPDARTLARAGSLLRRASPVHMTLHSSSVPRRPTSCSLINTLPVTTVLR